MAQEPLSKLHPELWIALGRLKSMRTYSQGTSLFRRGRPARGVFLVEKGAVRLLLQSDPKAERIFDVAGPGAVLGLSESMTGECYKLTAEAAECVQISYIERGELLHFLQEHHEFCLQIVRLLSEDLHVLYGRYRSMDTLEGRPKGKTSSRRVN